MVNENNKFVIVGGGSAGWMTALFVLSKFPRANITVIQSSQIGILGAGEATTNHFVDFLKIVNISVTDIIKNAKATIKNGVKFTNWHGDNTYYYNTFEDDFLDHSLISQLDSNNYPLIDMEQIALNLPFSNINFNTIISQKDQVKYIFKSVSEKDPLNHFKKIGDDALHFDAAFLARYFEKIGLERGIQVIEGIVKGFSTDEFGNIKTVSINEQSIDCDFIFDCSGFRKLIIGDFYKIPWKSHKKHLPVDKAIPFFIDYNKKKIPSCTEAIAMKYGWMWKTPVQDRFGCGYVFDSNYINEDEAKDEVEEYLGYSIKIPKIFNFEPGRFEKIYHNNCLSVGLSGSFIEPLEASSIQISLHILDTWADHLDDHEFVNRSYNLYYELIIGFIYFRYITKRDDTLFWKNFTNNTEAPPSANNFLRFKEEFINFDFFNDSRGGIRTAKTILACGHGQRLFNTKEAERIFKELKTEKYDKLKDDYLKKLEYYSDKTTDHYEFIEYIKNY